MNRSDFLRMIDNSGPSDRQTIVEVNELISVFPYFQSAYVLLLKGLQNTADVKFENQLRSYAMHIADREVLYYFLNRENKPAEAENIKPPLPPQVRVTEESGDSQQTVIESAKNSQDFINEIERDSSDGNIAGGPADRQVIISAENDPESSDTTILIIDDESGNEERIVYMDPGFSVAEESELLELDTDDKTPAAMHDDSSGSTERPSEPAISAKKLQSELIDRFIDANPRIEPVRVKSEKPVGDISKPFVEERGSFVTETLARIYVSQGYYSRAIEIYEKLSLKFPEKSSYFASQIEKVKELIKK